MFQTLSIKGNLFFNKKNRYDILICHFKLPTQDVIMLNKHLLIYTLFTLFSCSTVTAGPLNWQDAEKYISIQQKQFCDLTDNYVVDLYNAQNSRNEIKINKVKKQRQEDLDALLPEGKFQNWIVKVVSVKQVNTPKNQITDGDSAAVFELSCGSQIGSGTLNIDGQVYWGATIDYDSREYREISKLSSGQFAIISGTFLKLNDFLPKQKETHYASRPLTSADLLDEKNSKYGNGDELFLSFITYVAAAN